MAQYIQIWNKTLRRSRFQKNVDWLDILWSLFHLFVLDRLIGDARWGGRLLGIVGGGQSQRGGGDKKKEKALKDRWKNIDRGIKSQTQSIHFTVLHPWQRSSQQDQTKCNLCLVLKTWSKWWSQLKLRKESLLPSWWCCWVRSRSGEWKWQPLLYIYLACAQIRRHTHVFPRRAYVGVVSGRFAPLISFSHTHNFMMVLRLLWILIGLENHTSMNR